MREIPKLFQPQQGKQFPDLFGRLLVVFRDPMDRALNRYEQVKLKTDNEQISLTGFVSDPNYTENNPMIRLLLGIDDDVSLTDEHLETAKQIVSGHVVVGLFSALPETLIRFQKLLKWYMDKEVPEIYQQCHRDIVERRVASYVVKGKYEADDAVGFNTLLARQHLDLILYEHAVSIFGKQGTAFAEAEQIRLELLAKQQMEALAANRDTEGLLRLAQSSSISV